MAMDHDEDEEREEPEGEDVAGVGDEDDDEEEEEGQDEYERDGWMVDEDEEEEGGEEEEEEDDEEERGGKPEKVEDEDEKQEVKKKKKRRKREEDLDELDELDEDDYALLKESGIRRPMKKDKKFKRLKKAKRSDEGGRGLFDDEEEDVDVQQRVERQIFDDEGGPADFQEAEYGDDLMDQRGMAEEAEEGEEDEEDEEEDEMADFIVEGREEVDEMGRRRRKKKKKGARIDGVASEALLEAQDIFGDVADLLEARRQQLEQQRYMAEEGMEGYVEGEEGGEGRRPSALEAQYEPSLLASQFLTKRDDEIRKKDVPERIQLLEALVGAYPEGEDPESEAEWLFDHVFGKDTPQHSRRLEFSDVLEAERRAKMCPSEVVKEMQAQAAAARERALQQVAGVLQQMHDAKVEVPYIGLHKKNICPSLVERDTLNEKPALHNFEALWAIHRWDTRWLLLQRRRRSLWTAYSRPRLDEDEEAERQLALPGVELALLSARSELALDDVDVKFNLQFPPEDAVPGGGGGGDGGRHKRPQKRSTYAVCRRAGLKGVVKAMGLSAFQLGDNLAHMYKFHEVEDPTVSPEAVATEFVCAEFSDVNIVLKAARHMAVVEISVEPGVKEHVRAFFNDKAAVTTQPTTKGKQVIDTFHRYSGTEWLTGKPLSKFNDEQWLLISKAQDEGLLEVTLGLTAQEEDTLTTDFENAYISDGVSKFATMWNEQRRMVLSEALTNRLLPAMQREAKLALAARARDHLSNKVAAAMWERVSVAPYDLRSKNSRRQDDDGRSPWLRVLACCWGPGNPATTFAMLDAAGELLEVLHTPFLCTRWGGGGGQNEQVELNADQQIMARRKENDGVKLRDLMMEHKPHVVVVGASNLACRKLKEEIFEVICTIVERHPKSLAPEVDDLQVVYEDDVFASLYEKSAMSLKHFPDQPDIARRAIGLGRYLQNRLALTACLFGPEREVLSAKMHPAQDLLGADEVYAALERSMVSVTNQVGVDVNFAASTNQDWLLAPLQFVCGLGPRKAAQLQSQIIAEGVVRRRKALVEPPFSLGPTVFINAASALRIRGQDDLLDDSRIHPADYRLALKLALEGYCVAKGGSLTAEDVEDQGIDVVAEARENPDLIRKLDFEGYVAELEEHGEGRLKEKLLLIRRELMHGFAEARGAYRLPDQDEEFLLLSGETEDTLALGRVVTATVRRVMPVRVLCVLESGLPAVIDKRDFSDEDVELERVVKSGSVLTGRIKEVKRGVYQVVLTCKGSDLRSDSWRKGRQWDDYYAPHRAAAEAQAAEEEERRKKAEERKKLAFRPRMITYPLFENMSGEEAMEALAGRENGDVIIRPSSKGPTHLSVTMRFHDGIFTHIDIAESGKDRTSAASFLRLGKTLKIGDDIFEDLDEVMARYIDPVAGFVRDMAKYRKFTTGSKDEIDSKLMEQKEREPNRIPYFIAPSHEHRGAFMLAFIRSTRPVHEYITVSPKGYRYRRNYFATPDRLVKYFQQHFNDPIGLPEAPSNIPRRAVAAMVPAPSYPSYSPLHQAPPGPPALPYAGPQPVPAGGGWREYGGGSRWDSRESGRVPPGGWGPEGGPQRQGDIGGWNDGGMGSRGLPPPPPPPARSGPGGYNDGRGYEDYPHGGYPPRGQEGRGGGVGWGQGSWNDRGDGSGRWEGMEGGGRQGGWSHERDDRQRGGQTGEWTQGEGRRDGSRWDAEQGPKKPGSGWAAVTS